MEHKVGDRVRIKQLLGHPNFSGELAKILDIVQGEYLLELENTSHLPYNQMCAFSDWFINLEHLKPENTGKPINSFSSNGHIEPIIFTPSTQISFNFSLPVESYKSELWYTHNGVDYRVNVERMD
jgi:hypothetical protein